MKNNYRKIAVVFLLLWATYTLDKLIKIAKISNDLQILQYELLFNLRKGTSGEEKRVMIKISSAKSLIKK